MIKNPSRICAPQESSTASLTRNVFRSTTYCGEGRYLRLSNYVHFVDVNLTLRRSTVINLLNWLNSHEELPSIEAVHFDFINWPLSLVPSSSRRTSRPLSVWTTRPYVRDLICRLLSST